MLYRGAIGAFAMAVSLAFSIAGAAAFDETKYPDWSGQWVRPRGLATQWDQGKPSGLGQQAPLTPEYQARLEASIADQAAGGQGLDTRYKCLTNGMPRVMAAVFPNENNNHIVIGKDNYYMSGDGYLMPARKNQSPPDLRYFKPAAK